MKLKNKKLKILTVCRAGQVRSVTAANLLTAAGHTATAVGLRHKKAMKVAAALGVDLVLVVDYPEPLAPFVRKMFPDTEVRVMPTGKDVWLKPDHPELVKVLTPILGDLLK